MKERVGKVEHELEAAGFRIDNGFVVFSEHRDGSGPAIFSIASGLVRDIREKDKVESTDRS